MRENLRRGLVLGLLLLLAGCAIKPVSPEKTAGIRTIGVISALGDEITLKKIGITVFGNDEKTAPVESWKIDESVVRRVSGLLGKRFSVRPVTCDRSAFRAADTFDKIGEIVRTQAAPQGLDAYVVVTRAGSQVGESNQYIRGVGVLHASSLIADYVDIYALYLITVVDGRDFKPLGSMLAPAPENKFLPAIRGPHLDVDKSLWGNPAEAARNDKLRAALTGLLESSLPRTLQRLQVIGEGS
jgi:hypothetical protein